MHRNRAPATIFMEHCAAGAGGAQRLSASCVEAWQPDLKGLCMAESLAMFASINFAVIGLSHVFQAQAWRDFFQQLHSMGRAGAFANGMITLLMGALIVSFHNVWTGVPVILTLVGWGYILKSAIVFLNPDWGLRSMEGFENASPLKCRLAGAALIAIAIAVALCVKFDQY